MIAWIIRRAVANRFLVMMGALFLSVWGTWTIINTPVDALPDVEIGPVFKNNVHIGITKL